MMACQTATTTGLLLPLPMYAISLCYSYFSSSLAVQNENLKAGNKA